MSLDEEDVGRFSLTLLSDEAADTTSSLPFEERYKVTLEKLAESMKRSQDTRKCLTMKTPKTDEYPRTTSVSGVITSIEKSTQELLKVHLKKMQRI
jgi:CTP-dependent riboflavin kinase